MICLWTVFVFCGVFQYNSDAFLIRTSNLHNFHVSKGTNFHFRSINCQHTVLHAEESGFLDVLDGPGHTKAKVVSVSEKSHMELAKLIVSTAIILLTLKIKFDDILESFQLKRTNDLDGNLVTTFNDGLRYEDVIVGTDLPNFGEEIILESKVFFYGLQIKAFNEGQTMFKVKYGDFKSMSAVFGNLNINNDLTGYP